MERYVFKRFIVFVIVTLTILSGCSGSDKPMQQSPLPATVSKTESTQVPESATAVPAAVSPETKQDSEKGTKNAVKEIQGLVLLKQMDNTIICDLRYATPDNFTGKVVYPFNAAVLRKQTAEKLAKANSEFKKKGYRLKVWDAYRPIAVQKTFWELVKDERYVANPQKGGSNHNRGTAVDVTLVDQAGKELVMPSAFDDFSLKASRNNPDMTAEAKKNLELLTEVMTNCGFRAINTEWWHYDDIDSKNFSLMDIDIKAFQDNTEMKPEKQGESDKKKKGTQEQKESSSGLKFEKMKSLQDSQQVIFVTANSFDASIAQLAAYEKSDDRWREVISPIKVMIGRNGFTNNKKEGDGKSPIGVFSLRTCYSRMGNPGTKLKFIPFSQNDVWVDDSGSKYYNTFQKGPSNGRWNSAEDLYKIGAIYKYFVLIEYNTENIRPGKGSAIFMHIWERDGEPTSGCTAMAENNLLKIIQWLDPAKKPRIIQGPSSEIDKL